MYREIFTDRSYIRHGVKLEAGATVIDVGANVGMFAAFACKETGGQCRVLSFEPIPAIHRVLQANASALGKSFSNPQAVTPVRCGLASKPADSVEFHYHPHFSLWSSADAKFDQWRSKLLMEHVAQFVPLRNATFPPLRLLHWLMVLYSSKLLGHMSRTRPVRAELRTLSSVIDEHKLQRIDLLKVDVEGFEEEVLNGLEERHWPLVRQVVLEAETPQAGAKLRALLEGHGFAVQQEVAHANMPHGVNNLFAVRKA